ncbi:MAG: TPP-dependent pyruvate/acetoin dehydrogenase alpha subunit, partial [Planctomycetota bacterium]
TYRMMGHSSSDDPTVYRDEEEVAPWRDRDPIERFAKFLEGRGILAPGEAAGIEKEITQETDAEIHKQEAAPGMPLRSLVEDVYSEVPRHLMSQFNSFIETVERHGEAQKGDGAFPL